MNKVIEVNAERDIESVWTDTKVAVNNLLKVKLVGNP